MSEKEDEMRPIKIIGLASLAVLAMAFAGTASASAETSTQLCKVHKGLTCPVGEAVSSVHMTLAEGTVGILLSLVGKILCLGVLVESEPLALGKPQQIHTSNLTFSGCGYSSGHNNCTVTVEEYPLSNLLKVGLDEGLLTVTSGKARLQCASIGIDCKYDFEGTELWVNAQHLSAEETPTTELGGKFFCPGEGYLHGLLKALQTSLKTTSFLQPPLCKAHVSTCEAKDEIKSLHMTTTKPPVLFNTVANIECESSLAAATVLSAVEPQKLDATELTWKVCHTQGAADNCTVTSKGLPTLDLERTALNLGKVTTLGLKVGVDCTVLGLIELDCVYGSDVTLQFEGALHKEGTGHGMLTASKVVLNKLEGSEHCPESVKWDALYELSGHAYLGPLKEDYSEVTDGAYILQ